MQKKDFIRKIKLVSQFMMSQPEKQTVAIHVLPNISRSKCSQTIKFIQSIEYNMTNQEKLFPDLLLKSEK